MSDYLTLEAVERLSDLLNRPQERLFDVPCETIAVTLRAYAKVVEAVASDPIYCARCKYCDRYQLETPRDQDVLRDGWQHKSDCIYLLAQKLRGHA